MTAVDTDALVTGLRQVSESIFALRFRAPHIAAAAQPGQFVNVLTSPFYDPLLRRAYSISNVYGEECEILFAVVGKGTSLLARVREGDTLRVLGPLGRPFACEEPFQTAILVAGGIGIAPFPFLFSRLLDQGKTVIPLVGARCSSLIARGVISGARYATDDGSEGCHGTVVDLFEEYLSTNEPVVPRVFACGPNPMLAALRRSVLGRGIPCELSLESEMACGIGICQGCAVKRSRERDQYALVCTDGPCFDARDIVPLGEEGG
ncbi:MAG: dihydroorotate dehydrogenase electron transfer subunit [Bacteroidota bacterium]|nr:dihydroorotate dehydrogenase electron transfer subunit [Bacteroidota bacterium]